MKNKTSFLRKYSWLILVLLVACSNLPQAVPVSPTAELIPTQTNAAFYTSTEPETLSTPDLVSPLLATPTARVFESSNCSNAESLGHIFFMQVNPSDSRNHASIYDLYVMDGHGCFPRFVMSEVSGSPAWATDGKKLAVGCENNAFLCVLDVDATLNTCTGDEGEVGQCHAVVLQKFTLPPAIGGGEEMYNISWSSNGSQLIAEGGSSVTHHYFVYLLDLANGGTWKIFIQGLDIFGADWSPTEDQLVYSGLSFINLQSTKTAIRGFTPEWSPDGRKIAFITDLSDATTEEPYGIAAIDVQSGNWEWLYKPAPRDQYYYPPQNLAILDDGGYHRLLSWSPDAKYMAFSAAVPFGNTSYIFRLNIATGEIVNLAANLKPKEGVQSYYAPAWGP